SYRALARRPPLRCCCRSPSRWTLPAGSSCWPASTTAPNMAGPPPPSCSTIPAERRRVFPASPRFTWAAKGAPGPALRFRAIASFVAGTVGVIGLTLVAPPVAAFALSFSSPEYFALMCLGLALVVLLSGSSLIKGLLSLLLGLWLTSIGTDLFTAQSRFIFGQATLLGGIDFMVVAIGVFAIGEVLGSVEAGEEAKVLPV